MKDPLPSDETDVRSCLREDSDIFRDACHEVGVDAPGEMVGVLQVAMRRVVAMGTLGRALAGISSVEKERNDTCRLQMQAKRKFSEFETCATKEGAILESTTARNDSSVAAVRQKLGQARDRALHSKSALADVRCEPDSLYTVQREIEVR